MESRINYNAADPNALKAMYGLGAYVEKSGLEPSLVHLLEFRVSQINGCAYCLDMHSKDLRVADETEQRLYVLDAWREAPFYTERERAALAWAEAVTLVGCNKGIASPVRAVLCGRPSKVRSLPRERGAATEDRPYRLAFLC
jgi:AhpD family alkylhydroperoxidase